MNDPRRAPKPLITAGGRTDPDATAAAGPGDAWDTLATSLGGLPRVLLRDTDADGETPSEPPSRPGSAEMPPPGNAPQRLQLLGELARGGMGAVLKGRDPDLCRDIAVKVLLDKHRDDPGLLCRFVEEAQIAGQLQHPGIVPVYRLGTLPDRRPYFSMKLVKGRTLAALLTERSDRADDLPRFVSIFEQVCRTMAYAHSRLVIHRDLKPSNIMVGGFGEVQVMDWGLAKVLARGEEAPRPDEASPANETVVATARGGPSGSDLSSAGSVIGTPAYMAPEQARGEIHRVDMRADVFALGAILCEVLTGRPPYVGRVPGEVQRKAARGDTAEALAAIDASDADPELIAMAHDCLAAEPDDRPADARAVADRAGSHLAGVGHRLRQAELDRAAEAARAEEAEAAAGAERRARRLTVGLAAAVLMMIGLAGGGYAWLESERSARRAATERAVEADLRRARDLQAEALAAPADRPGPWAEALASARGAEDRLRQGEADEPLRHRVAQAVGQIEQGRDQANERAARIAADRRLLAELESVRGARAEHWDSKRTDAEYAAAFRDAGLDLDATDPERAGAWIAARSDSVELASFLDDWAAVRAKAGADGKSTGRLVAAARTADPEPWRDALRAGFGAGGPAALESLRKLAGDEETLGTQPAESLLLLALRLKTAGDREGAARVLRRAWRMRPDDFWVNYELARSRGPESGSIAEMFPRPEEAMRHLTAAIAVRPGSPMAHSNLGGILMDVLHDPEAAVAELRTAIRLKPDHANAHTNLGNVLLARGEREEAIAELRTAIRLKPDHAVAHGSLGNALHDQRKYEEAGAEFRAAIRLQPDHAVAHGNLGLVLHDQRKYEEAGVELRTAIRLKPDYADAHVNLGNVLLAQGRRDDAIAEFREAVRLKPDHALAHHNLGLALGGRQDMDEAIAELRATTRLRPDFAQAHGNLGVALDARGKRDEAIAEFREAVRLEPDYALAHCNLGQSLLRQGRFREALAEYRRGHELGSKRTGWRHPSAEWVRYAEQMAALDARLPAVIRGEDRPGDAADGLALAEVAYSTGRPVLSARLYGEALKADPRLGDDRRARHRYNAARAAARAGCGQGRDDPPPDEAARAGLRKQALDWLGAELNAWGRVLDTGDPKARAGVAATLRHWKEDSDLAGIRDAVSLTKLPESESKPWQALWADVDRLLRRAGGEKP
jgi:eukaryotic-like serine/threonine-protein kinase